MEYKPRFVFTRSHARRGNDFCTARRCKDAARLNCIPTQRVGTSENLGYLKFGSHKQRVIKRISIGYEYCHYSDE